MSSVSLSPSLSPSLSLQSVLDVEPLRLSLCLCLSLRDVVQLQRTSRALRRCLDDSAALVSQQALHAVLQRSGRCCSVCVSPSQSLCVSVCAPPSLSAACVLASRLTPWPSDFSLSAELLQSERYCIETLSLSLPHTLTHTHSHTDTLTDTHTLTHSASSSLKQSASLSARSAERPTKCILYRGAEQGRDRSIVANEHFPLCLSSRVSESLPHALSALPFAKTVAVREQSSSGARLSRSLSLPVLSFVSYFEISVHSQELAPPLARTHTRSHTRAHMMHAHMQRDVSPCVAIGIARCGFRPAHMMPGWDEHSYALHGDDGLFFCGDSEEGLPLFPLSFSSLEARHAFEKDEEERAAPMFEARAMRERGDERARRKRETAFTEGDTVGFGILYPSSLCVEGERVKLPRRRDRHTHDEGVSKVRGFWSREQAGDDAHTHEDTEDSAASQVVPVSLARTTYDTHPHTERERERDQGWFFFTKNGRLIAAAEINDPHFFKHAWFPVVGIDSYCPVSFNFGNDPQRPFAFDVVAWEREHVEAMRTTSDEDFSLNDADAVKECEGEKADNSHTKTDDNDRNNDSNNDMNNESEPEAKRLRTHDSEDERSESPLSFTEEESEVSRFFRALHRVRAFWAAESERERTRDSDRLQVPPKNMRYPWFEDVYADWGERKSYHDKSIPDISRSLLFFDKALSRPTRVQAMEDRFHSESNSDEDSDEEGDAGHTLNPMDFLRMFSQFASRTRAGAPDMASLRNMLSRAMPQLPLEEMELHLQQFRAELEARAEGAENEENDETEEDMRDRLLFLANGLVYGEEESEFDSDSDSDSGSEGNSESDNDSDESESENEDELTPIGRSGADRRESDDEEDGDAEEEEHGNDAFATMTFGKGIC